MKTRTVTTENKTTRESAKAELARSPGRRVVEAGQGPGNQALLRMPKRERQQLRPSQVAPGGVPPIVHEVLRSPGEPLGPGIRGFMEERFAHDFGDVRVHTDAKAAESARAVGALAYTVGRDVAFGAGQYSPGTSAGRGLLAHEIAHTLQQCASGAVACTSPSSLPMEREAAHASRSVTSNLATIDIMLRTGIGLACQAVGAQETVDASGLTAGQQEIEPGDVVVRAGTFSGKNPLVTIIGEQYNHGGIALDSGTVHHTEANGYETVTTRSFFDPANARGGAVLRFRGPCASQIRDRAVSIIEGRRYLRIPGNPFSTADDLRTVNCNEFVHEVYRQAIAELISDSQARGESLSPGESLFWQLLTEYGDPRHAGRVKELIAPKAVEFATGGFTTGPAVTMAEIAGGHGVSEEAAARGEVRVQFEGELQMRNLYPRDWGTSWWNPLKVHLYSEGFYTVAVLRTYTPDSFINSHYFALVRRLTARGR
ncbi:MAG: DUF4157 domain-containing protein [Armatimonadota bacterium]|nr:DUF4157 domain-containing protein [Armatimonadota bacterium]